jgi:amino-acid N-acetyltransferase
MTIAAAQPDDLPAIRALLAAIGLPEADLTSAHLGTFWVSRDAAGLAAVVGLEPHGRAALLRSLAVRADRRGGGLGAALLSHAEAQAVALGTDALYLLTTTADRFFVARGYAVIARDAAPPAIRATREFADLCPASSICMTKRVGA